MKILPDMLYRVKQGETSLGLREMCGLYNFKRLFTVFSLSLRLSIVFDPSSLSIFLRLCGRLNLDCIGKKHFTSISKSQWATAL